MEPAKKEFVQRMTAHVNKSDWWHVPPLDRTAYSKRGKFYASSFVQAEFYGRPLDEAQRVTIAKPFCGIQTHSWLRLLKL
jgi:hypothetical protein